MDDLKNYNKQDAFALFDEETAGVLCFCSIIAAIVIGEIVARFA